MATLEIPESHRDLLTACPIVILATVGPDGVPQVTANWFLADESGTVRLSLTTARQKVKNIRRHPVATLFFVDPANPYRTLEIRARAEMTPDPEYTLADKVSARYGGPDLRTMDQPGEERMAVTFVPIKINTYG
jgi:PPOX class probable F420-dependent enzyme